MILSLIVFMGVVTTEPQPTPPPLPTTEEQPAPIPEPDAGPVPEAISPVDMVKKGAIPDEVAYRCIVGTGLRGAGMDAVASAIRNRDAVMDYPLRGVQECKATWVDKEAAEVWAEAKAAWDRSKDTKTHNGTHWANLRFEGEPDWAYNMVVSFQDRDTVFFKLDDR